ncbi:hypothetical protein ACQEU3_38235 [Spirillospora sp. CA-253888]
MKLDRLTPAAQVPQVHAFLESCPSTRSSTAATRSLVVPYTLSLQVDSELAASPSVVLQVREPRLQTYVARSGRCGLTASAFGGEIGPGSSDTETGWIVYQDAITPKHPQGDPAKLGATQLWVDIAGMRGGAEEKWVVYGSAVCRGGLLHLAGRATAEQKCGRYPDRARALK